MATIQVKRVPAPVHAELRRRAELEHKSLRDYVLDLILRDQMVPPRSEWLERVRALQPVKTTKSSAEWVRESREEEEARGRRR